MFVLVVIGLLAGVITSISPCVLPVLPVILTAGADTGPDTKSGVEDGAHRGAGAGSPAVTGAPIRRWRPYGIVAGLVLSFTLSTLCGSLVLAALDLPQNLLRDAGIVVLVVIGFGLLLPRLGEWLERPFARLPGKHLNPENNGLLLGLGLGLLFVPCAGPVLAAIAVVGAAHRVSFGALVLTASFGVGVGIPLLLLALAGATLSRRVATIRTHARRLRAAGGVVMILVALAVGLNLTDGLQRHVPGYTDALQRIVEANPDATNRLRDLAAAPTPSQKPSRPDASCTEGGTGLVNCGSAPELTGITGWLNTPGNQPLSLAQLRGKTVLIDFWTYSCINCQRTLPHLEAWDRAYRQDGLVIIGVHTPEFAFEHVASNIVAQSAALGVHYPIAIDNDYNTWNAYGNEYWPAEYLIDPNGVIRHVSFGEGEYSNTEELIRQLLAEHDPNLGLPPSTEVPDATPMNSGMTAETYLGTHYSPLHVSGRAPGNGPADYHFPATLNPDTFALAGSWNAGDEQLTASPGAMLELSYQANEVYLVLGGQGSVTVRNNGEALSTVQVSGPPKLYPLLTHGSGRRGTLTLSFTPGVLAYDFTFG